MKHCIFTEHFPAMGQTQGPGPHAATVGSGAVQWLCHTRCAIDNGILCLSPLKSPALKGHRSAAAEQSLSDSCAGTVAARRWPAWPRCIGVPVTSYSCNWHELAPLSPGSAERLRTKQVQMHALLLPQHQLPRSGLEPIILRLSGILCLPPRNTGLQPSPQSLTQLWHRIITAKNESCIEVKQCFPVTFHRRRCITTVERDDKAVGRVRAREEGVLVLKAPRGCCKTDPGTQGMRADKGEDCLHGPRWHK